MDINSKIRQEMLWKNDLCATGTRIELAALEGVGTEYKENYRYIFNWITDEFPPDSYLPSDIVFPEGTVVLMNHNLQSPYLIRRDNSQLILEKDGKFLTTIRYVKRPAFYSKKTSAGIPMHRVVPLSGACGAIVCFTTTCNYFATGDQCKFCNFNSAGAKGEHENLLAPQFADQIAEVIEAMVDEGIDPCPVFSSGSVPVNTIMEAVIRVLKSMTARPKIRHVIPRICFQSEGVKDLSWLDKLYEAGLRRINPNIEIWDPDMFRYICPGKSKRIGREQWLKTLRYAVKVFGPPNVYSGLVTGIETKETIYEATDVLTDWGLWPLITPWWTQGGTSFEGHRPPVPEWVLEVNEKVMDIMVKKIPQILSDQFFNFPMGGCYRCNNVTLMADELRIRHNGRKKVFQSEKALR